MAKDRKPISLILGGNIRSRILKFFYKNLGFDFNINEVKKELNISYDRAYNYIKDFEKKGLLIGKEVGKTIRYSPNLKNEEVISIFSLFELARKKKFLNKEKEYSLIINKF